MVSENQVAPAGATSKQEEVLVFVACTNAAGAPEIYAVPVNVTKDEYDNGDHYNVAKERASAVGYEDPMLAFDHRDPAGEQIISGVLASWSSRMLSNDASPDQEEVDKFAAFLSERVEDGVMPWHDVPRIMARYGLTTPDAFRAEMAERMDHAYTTS